MDYDSQRRGIVSQGQARTEAGTAGGERVAVPAQSGGERPIFPFVLVLSKKAGGVAAAQAAKVEDARNAGVELAGVGDRKSEFFLKRGECQLHSGLPNMIALFGAERYRAGSFGKAPVLSCCDGRGKLVGAEGGPAFTDH